MKILYVIHVYWPNYQAGSENYTHYIAQEMKKRGHDVSVFTVETLSDNSYHVERYDEDGVFVFKIHKNDDAIRSLDDTYIDSKIDNIFNKVICELQPDIVHIQHLRNLSVNIIDIIKGNDIPVIFTLHDIWIECFQGKRLETPTEKLCTGASLEKCSMCYRPERFIKHKSIIDKVYLKVTRLSGYSKKISKNKIKTRMIAMNNLVNNVTLFISPSKHLKKTFIEWGVPENKIIYSRNGMHIIQKNDRDNGVMQKNNKVKFVFTSHIKQIKGVKVLLDACYILQQRGIIDIEVQIYGKIGNDKYGEEFIENVKNIESVKYKGSFQNIDVNNILRNADYMIVASIQPENAPLVIDEAYLNNVPCIVSNIGGMAERVDDGVNGLHFEVGDAHDLADKMEYVVKNKGVREVFVKNIPHVKSIEENAVELEKIYESMI